MSKLTLLPGNKIIEVENDTLILEAALEENVSHAHAYGGEGKCTSSIKQAIIAIIATLSPYGRPLLLIPSVLRML